MKILQLIDLFCPSGGGSTDILRKLAYALTQKGHEVTIYTSDYQLDRDYINSLQDVNVYPFRGWLNPLGIFMTPSIIPEAWRNLKDFDIIHLHWHRSFQAVVIHHYARKYSIPYVVDDHGTPRVSLGAKGIKQLLWWLFDVVFGYRILKDAARVIAESGVGVDEYKDLGVTQDKIVVIMPPLDVNEFSRLPARGLFRKKYGIKQKHIVMFLGRLHWMKGVDFLIESFYELTRVREDVVLAIVGNDDGYKPALDKLIENLNLADKVFYTGYLGGGDKLAALVDADVVVQASVYEQGVRVPFEAILCDAPVIYTRHTGAGEILGRMDAGYPVEYGNNSELRDMIQLVLDGPAEAATKTQRVKEYVKANLSLEKGIEKYEELYRQLSSGRRK